MDRFMKEKKSGSIAKRWRLLSGENNWRNMLDPLDLDLRRYIIHYGERAEATYDAFNSNEASKYAGCCMYPMDEFFSKVGLEKGNPYKYHVTKYFYATSSDPDDGFIIKSSCRDSWCKDSNWMGYIAVTTDEGKAVLGRRDIIIAWRGTILARDWTSNLEILLVSVSKMLGVGGDPMVHQGWHNIYTSANPRSSFNQTSARDQVLSEVRRLVELYKNEEISITTTGHSMGGALATMTAVDIVANKVNKPKDQPSKACPVTAFVFACPRVGNSNFKNVLSKLENLHVLCVRNAFDSVPYFPQFDYVEVGEQLAMNTNNSNYLKSGDFGSWHNLEVYLHGVAGTQGPCGAGFKLEVKRCIALVNKGTDGLKDKYGIPVSWWSDPNKKGMVQQDDGSWELMG